MVDLDMARGRVRSPHGRAANRDCVAASARAAADGFSRRARRSSSTKELHDAEPTTERRSETRAFVAPAFRLPRRAPILTNTDPTSHETAHLPRSRRGPRDARRPLRPARARHRRGGAHRRHRGHADDLEGAALRRAERDGASARAERRLAGARRQPVRGRLARRSDARLPGADRRCRQVPVRRQELPPAPRGAAADQPHQGDPRGADRFRQAQLEPGRPPRPGRPARRDRPPRLRARAGVRDRPACARRQEGRGLQLRRRGDDPERPHRPRFAGARGEVGLALLDRQEHPGLRPARPGADHARRDRRPLRPLDDMLGQRPAAHARQHRATRSGSCPTSSSTSRATSRSSRATCSRPARPAASRSASRTRRSCS